VFFRDKKARRAEKQKGKRKDDDNGKHVGNNSSQTPSSPTTVDANHQDGDPIPEVPPLTEEVQFTAVVWCGGLRS